MKFSAACTAFRLDPRTATWAAVRVVYRHAARLAHPDCGGDRKKWDEFQAAYLRLKEELDRPRRCPECLGQRVVKTMKRGRVSSTPCPTCQGRGDLPSEEI